MPDKLLLNCKDMLTTWGRFGGIQESASPVSASRCRRGGIIDGGHHGEVGYFIEPTVIVGARPGMTVVEEEIFGLVITVQWFDSTEEVVAVAYGLAGGLWTRDLALAHSVAAKLRTGTVWVNSCNHKPHGWWATLSNALLPCGSGKSCTHTQQCVHA